MSEKDIHDRDVHMLQQSDGKSPRYVQCLMMSISVEIWEKSILLSYRYPCSIKLWDIFEYSISKS